MAEEVDALEEFKSKLRRQAGDWYVVHTYSGYENKVKTGIETRIQNLEAEDEIFEVQVPMETVVEFKNTVKKTIRRVRVPGYVLVRMELTDHSWGVVRHTPGVTGFVGQDAYNPVPLRMDEVFDMLLPVFEEQQQSPGPACFQARYRVRLHCGRERPREVRCFRGHGRYRFGDQGRVPADCRDDFRLRPRYPGDLELHRDRKDLTFLACEYEPRTSVWGSYFVVVA